MQTVGSYGNLLATKTITKRILVQSIASGKCRQPPATTRQLARVHRFFLEIPVCVADNSDFNLSITH